MSASGISKYCLQDDCESHRLCGTGLVAMEVLLQNFAVFEMVIISSAK
jgi:hypothetical protein